MDIELGIILIIMAAIIALMYGKMILIWRNVNLKKNNEKMKKMINLNHKANE